jgi:hypothetical protein
MQGYIEDHKVNDLANCRTIYQLIALHESKGGYFFSDGSKKFFNSRIGSDVYGGCVFVTSEKQSYKHNRYYTVRYMDSTGNTHTVGDFQGFETRQQAHRFAKKLGDWIATQR